MHRHRFCIMTKRPWPQNRVSLLLVRFHSSIRHYPLPHHKLVYLVLCAVGLFSLWVWSVRMHLYVLSGPEPVFWLWWIILLLSPLKGKNMVQLLMSMDQANSHFQRYCLYAMKTCWFCNSICLIDVLSGSYVDWDFVSSVCLLSFLIFRWTMNAHLRKSSSISSPVVQ